MKNEVVYGITKLKSEMEIDGIYTVHYFEYAKNFAFSGESHAFWELVYADKRSLIITAGDKELKLERGQMYLHRPYEFHNLRCDGEHAANSAIISFGGELPELDAVAGKVIDCTPKEKRLIAGIIREAGSAFATPLGLLGVRQMQKSENGEFGCEHLIKSYLEQLLIVLVRAMKKKPTENYESGGKQFSAILRFLEENVSEKLRFGDVAKHFSLSPSILKRDFRRQTGCGVMEYFTKLKIDAAKQLIRESELNFTEIAAELSFGSSQYFTAVFRRVTGMTPSEYRESVLK